MELFQYFNHLQTSIQHSIYHFLVLLQLNLSLSSSLLYFLKLPKIQTNQGQEEFTNNRIQEEKWER
jgi:hypothetical protein